MGALNLELLRTIARNDRRLGIDPAQAAEVALALAAAADCEPAAALLFAQVYRDDYLDAFSSAPGPGAAA